MRTHALAILVGSSAVLPAGLGCCRAEPSLAATEESPAPPWSASPEAVHAIEATIDARRISVTREPSDPELAWCRIVTEVPGRAPRTIEFPVEGRTAQELFRSIATPRAHEALGVLKEAELAARGLDGDDAVAVTIDGELHRLRIGSAPEVGTRPVLDSSSGRAWIVNDDWWRTLEAAERLLPLRKLVERRGLERVTIHVGGRTRTLALRSDGWVPEDPAVERARVEAVVLAALRLRPGAFDRGLDTSSLDEIVRFEFTGGERPQTLTLFTDGAEAYFVRSTRAVGVAKVHHLDAIALAAEVADLR